jgi:2-polyprenyl-3-methyl-5-hydroxy-6-metoxy-1,4-benzoquinol methylase
VVRVPSDGRWDHTAAAARSWRHESAKVRPLQAHPPHRSPPDIRCRVCDSSSLARLFRVKDCDIDRCRQCGFAQVRAQPQPETLAAIYGASYFERGKYDDDANQQRENRRRLALLRRLALPAGARVLDAGCATGDFVKVASSRYDCWGLDVSTDAVRIARERYPELSHRFDAGSLESAAFGPGSFDAVVLWDVIEHLWDPRTTCERMLAALRPGGFLVLSTPDIGALTARAMGPRWAFMTPPEHLGFFSAASMRWLLEHHFSMTTVASFTRGKWVNLGFLTYKLRRVVPELMPAAVASWVQQSRLARAALYVPTADIRYVAARKGED